MLTPLFSAWTLFRWRWAASWASLPREPHLFAVFARLTFRLTIYEQRWASSLSPAGPFSMDRLLDCRFGRAIIAPLWGGIPAHKLRGWQMSDPELIAKCTPEINKMQRQRNAQGLPALSAEQANRLRTVINARHAVLHRMRAGRQRTESHWVPLGLTILVFVLAFGVAVVSRIVRR
jgi:hypothetical protein